MYPEPQNQPEPQTQPPATSVEPDPRPIEELGAESTGGKEPGAPSSPPPPQPEPFTDKEILEGSAFLILMGVRPRDEFEVATFLEGYQWVLRPLLPTAKLLEPLGLGKALARYGLHKGGSLDSLANWHPLARLGIGALTLAAAAYGGVRAVQKERAQQTGPAPEGAGVADADRGAAAGASPKQE